jgi:Protein of unknown function (DUF3341)
VTGDAGWIAEFEDPEALLEALRAAKREGYTRLDAFGPFPLPEVTEELGLGTRFLSWTALGAGIVGAAVQYGAQYWMNVVDYPLNIGGRPLHSWPMFLPSVIIVGFLWASLATFVALLVSTGLPRPHHPLFDVPGFERASGDRFFLWVGRNDPRSDAEATPRLLEGLSPRAVRKIAA